MTGYLELKNFITNEDKFYIADLSLELEEVTTSHTHDFYEFYVVLEGVFEETSNKKKRIIYKDGLQFIKPSDVHAYKNAHLEGKSTLRNIAIEKVYFEQFMKQYGISNLDKFFERVVVNPAIIRSFKYKTNLLLESQNKKQIRNILFESVLSDMVLQLLVYEGQEDEIPTWLSKAYKEMKKKENYYIGLTQFVILAGKSQEHLTRCMKKYYSLTPAEYINELRLSEATKLLREESFKIVDILYDCGFNNIAYFNRVFKEKYGMSPTEYRQHNKKFF